MKGILYINMNDVAFSGLAFRADLVIFGGILRINYPVNFKYMSTVLRWEF